MHVRCKVFIWGCTVIRRGDVFIFFSIDGCICISHVTSSAHGFDSWSVLWVLLFYRRPVPHCYVNAYFQSNRGNNMHSCTRCTLVMVVKLFLLHFCWVGRQESESTAMLGTIWCFEPNTNISILPVLPVLPFILRCRWPWPAQVKFIACYVVDSARGVRHLTLYVIGRGCEFTKETLCKEDCCSITGKSDCGCPVELPGENVLKEWNFTKVKHFGVLTFQQ